MFTSRSKKLLVILVAIISFFKTFTILKYLLYLELFFITSLKLIIFFSLINFFKKYKY